MKRIYQLKIVLNGMQPQVWRVIQIPETFNFFELHLAIQNAMGWENYHPYQFNIINNSNNKIEYCVGIPDNECDIEVLDSYKSKIRKYFLLDRANYKITYEYNFEDSWVHDVILEKILQSNKDVIYPTCIDGEFVCPPEDCGGISEDRFVISKNFDLRNIIFDSPIKHLKKSFHRR